MALTRLNHASMPSGSILQVKQTVMTARQTTTSTSELDITGASVSITPKFSNSKILINVAIPCIANDVGTIRSILYRGTTEITESGLYSLAGGWEALTITMNFIDSPATASAVTYKVANQMGAAGSGIYFNYADTNAGFSTVNDGRGVITATEIAV